jgi:O-methyltransferase involved in polyketide biosynthesis
MLEGIGDVATTSFVTLYCHAIETRADRPILSDPRSVEIATELDKHLSSSNGPLEKALVSGTLDRRLVVHIALRAKRYDDYVRDFLAKSPDGVVVNIGCGLDPRFERIDNGRVVFYDLDLPEIIALRSRFFTESERYRVIASSVLDAGWMARVRQHPGPFLFMAEGVFMYLAEDDVRSLVRALQATFPGSELVCEVVNAIWLGPLLRPVLAFKMQRQLHLGRGAVFRSGLRDGREMEEWQRGIQFLDEWSYFDSDEERLGWMRLLRHIGPVRTTQWTVHYRLN